MQQDVALDKIYSVLANAKRRSMIHHLSLQPLTVQGLARVHSLSLPAMHKHINLLLDANLVIRKKVGRVNFVALNKATLRIAQDWLTQYRTWGNDKRLLENYIAKLHE